jgi:phage terminase Nu1 subunit (DNA packaging protein)
MRVSTADLARVLGVTERRVQQLENVGVLRHTEHGEWDLAESVQAYLQHRLKAKRTPAARGKAEERLKEAKASREVLKLAVEEGRLIDVDEALAIIDEIVGTFRADLTGIPARLTRDMTWREKIETEIDGALCRCADLFAERAEAMRARGHIVATAEADDAGSVGGGEP